MLGRQQQSMLAAWVAHWRGPALVSAAGRPLHFSLCTQFLLWKGLCPSASYENELEEDSCDKQCRDAHTAHVPLCLPGNLS